MSIAFAIPSSKAREYSAMVSLVKQMWSKCTVAFWGTFNVSGLGYIIIIPTLAQKNNKLKLIPENKIWLVVWNPLKNISQLGWLSPIYGKIKNVPNHQPASNAWTSIVFYDILWFLLHPWQPILDGFEPKFNRMFHPYFNGVQVPIAQASHQRKFQDPKME